MRIAPYPPQTPDPESRRAVSIDQRDQLSDGPSSSAGRRDPDTYLAAIALTHDLPRREIVRASTSLGGGDNRRQSCPSDLVTQPRHPMNPPGNTQGEGQHNQGSQHPSPSAHQDAANGPVANSSVRHAPPVGVLDRDTHSRHVFPTNQSSRSWSSLGEPSGQGIPPSEAPLEDRPSVRNWDRSSLTSFNEAEGSVLSENIQELLEGTDEPQRETEAIIREIMREVEIRPHSTAPRGARGRGRKQYTHWTSAEVTRLLLGLKALGPDWCGIKHWDTTHRRGPALLRRTNVQIKDKTRTLIEQFLR